MRKAGLQVCCYAGDGTDLVEQICGTKEETLCMYNWYRPSFGRIIRVRLAAALSAAVGWHDISGFRIKPANQFPPGTGLLLFLVPVGC